LKNRAKSIDGGWGGWSGFFCFFLTKDLIFKGYWDVPSGKNEKVVVIKGLFDLNNVSRFHCPKM
jgi:hypothetical protein